MNATQSLPSTADVCHCLLVSSENCSSGSYFRTHSTTSNAPTGAPSDQSHRQPHSHTPSSCHPSFCPFPSLRESLERPSSSPNRSQALSDNSPPQENSPTFHSFLCSSNRNPYNVHMHRRAFTSAPPISPYTTNTGLFQHTSAGRCELTNRSGMVTPGTDTPCVHPTLLKFHDKSPIG